MRFAMCFFSSLQTRVLKNCTVAIGQSTAHLHTRNIKPSEANQAHRKSLKSNSIAKTLEQFRDLLRKSPSCVDSFSILFVLKACTRKSSSNGGRQLHGVIVKLGFAPIIFLQTSLISVYSAAGDLRGARQVFDEIPVRNTVCCTALVSSYVENKMPTEALRVFRQMLRENVEPDKVTLTVALSACADLGALDVGEWIHSYVCSKQGLGRDHCMNNAFINMYVKCGDAVSARRLFDEVKKKDVTTWTSMIVGYALNGQAEEALQLFSEMKEANFDERITRGCSFVRPNEVTFIGVLMACSHGGMVEEGKQHFRSMTEDYGLKPRLSHFGCMVDLLCRAGRRKEAYDFILEMPVKPNAVVWRTLLGACSLHGDIKLGKEVRRKLVELGGHHVGDNVIMSNIFAAEGMWEQKLLVRDQMKHRRAPGCSSIEAAGVAFVSADDHYPLNIYG